jgi:phosphinothricin acetyltransferase
MVHCRRFGYHHIVAKILADNQTSINLHEKFGFALVGVQREVGRLAGRWRDVAIYQLILHEDTEE